MLTALICTHLIIAFFHTMFATSYHRWITEDTLLLEAEASIPELRSIRLAREELLNCDSIHEDIRSNRLWFYANATAVVVNLGLALYYFL